MDYVQLDAIRKRLWKATDGPWEFDCDTHEIISRGFTVVSSSEYSQVDMSDAEFIAHARQDIPALLEEIERLNKEANA